MKPPETLEDLRTLVASMVGEPPDALGDDDNLLLDWGLDSIRVMAFADELARAGVEVELIELAERPTLAAWHALLSVRAGAGPPGRAA